MVKVIASTWALLLGVMLLMVGNGVQGTLLGIRGSLEGFSTLQMSFVMSAYFIGFLGGSRMAPEMIRRVGHVRVFAALGSFISAVLILYPTFANPWAWMVGRVIIGFCFSGVYVTAESWLNNSVTNDIRGKALSLYMIVQMVGIVAAQFLLVAGDPTGFILFVIPSVLVSISFAPILLSVQPTPAFGTTKPLTLVQLYRVSPLGMVGAFLLGGVYAAMFGMSAVFATQAGFTVAQTSFFVASIYVGGLLMQYPIGWVSDRMDRRLLIALLGLGGGIAGVFGLFFGGAFVAVLVAGFFIGGMSNPLYALIIAYTNDFLEAEDMAAASGGLIFINGVGAIAGPIVTGWFMGLMGPLGFFVYIALLMAAVAGYAFWRMTRRPSVAVEDTGQYAPVLPSSTAVVVDMAQEVFIENLEESDEAEETGEAQPQL
ncbi:MFS transporter [Vannielia litorea]|uniref:MFS transporter n=1 Tax=Vannielia litorea TaxID=1217970 RepID=UPI001BCBA323|nr:MFS transporter [Vannielia litorea]MBS8228611.1 MFS transporter [Vannielia litorea]